MLNTEQIKEFFGRLEGPDGCDFKEDEEGKGTWKCKGGTDKSLAQAILEKMGVEPVEIVGFLSLCEERGGYCDCEIVFNAAEGLLDGADDSPTGRNGPSAD